MYTHCTTALLTAVISSIDGISSVDVSSLPLCSQDIASPSDYVIGINYRLVTLERRMKALEHVSHCMPVHCTYMYCIK